MDEIHNFSVFSSIWNTTDTANENITINSASNGTSVSFLPCSIAKRHFSFASGLGLNGGPPLVGLKRYSEILKSLRD